jgi:hypothetical protein
MKPDFNRSLEVEHERDGDHAGARYYRGLPADERLPDIARQLRVLEHLFYAAGESDSAAVPDRNDDCAWWEYFHALGDSVRSLRLLVDDIYSQAQEEGQAGERAELLGAVAQTRTPTAICARKYRRPVRA